MPVVTTTTKTKHLDGSTSITVEKLRKDEQGNVLRVLTRETKQIPPGDNESEHENTEKGSEPATSLTTIPTPSTEARNYLYSATSKEDTMIDPPENDSEQKPENNESEQKNTGNGKETDVSLAAIPAPTSEAEYYRHSATIKEETIIPAIETKHDPTAREETPKQERLMSDKKRLISSALLRRTIRSHGWICCREPKRVYEIGSQKILIDDINVYVDKEINDKEFQEAYAALSCMPETTCFWDKVPPTYGRRLTVIRRDEILAVSSESAWERKHYCCGCTKEQYKTFLISTAIITSFGCLLGTYCIMIPKSVKDKNDLTTTMHISVRRVNRDYVAIVPVDQIGYVADVIMSPAPERIEMKR